MTCKAVLFNLLIHSIAHGLPVQVLCPCFSRMDLWERNE